MRRALVVALALALAVPAVAPVAAARHACVPEVEPLCGHPEQELARFLCRVLGPFLPIRDCN